MGVIQKQGIQGSIWLYVGVFIGFITSAVLFPNLLEKEEIGLLYTLVSYSTVFAQFATLGFTSVITRNFSYFRNYENKHNHFFFLVFMVMLIGSLLSVLAFYILKPIIVSQNIANAPLFVEYIDYLVPLIVFTLVFIILDTFYTVLFKSVRGILLKEVFQRILILVGLGFYALHLLSFKGFTISYVIAIALPGLLLIIYTIVEGEWVIKPKIGFINPEMKRSMFSVGLFGVLTSLVGSANMQIDKAMASSMINLEATGVYAIVFTFATLIRVPSRALLKIAAAIIADAWKRNDTNEIRVIYKATCINQYIVALLVLIGLWANVDNIFVVLGPDYLSGKYVILWLGLAYTIEMASGASGNIIANSKEYKMLTWMVVITLIIMVITNLVFIPLYQVTGVAIATAITSLAYTFMRMAYVYYKYGMQPLDLKFIYLTAIGILVYFLSELIPPMKHFIFDIVLRSGLITLAYLVLTYIFNISFDFNSKLDQVIKLLRSKL